MGDGRFRYDALHTPSGSQAQRMPTSPRHIPFVGRVQEMAELKVALDDALVGRGGLVMLVGEPGIGKTRLTEELTASARDRGALVAGGACYEGGSTPP